MRSLRRDLIFIAAVAAAAVAVAVALLASGGSAPFTHNGSYDVRVMVPSAQSLGPGAEVRIAGVQIGRLGSIERRGNGAELRLKLEDDKAPIPADSQFALRLRSLIGENFIELYPGKSRTALPDAGVLPMTAQKFEYVDLEQILDLLKGRTRTDARRLLQGLGAGLDGRGADLNHVLGGAADLISGAEPVMRVLHADRARVSRLVEQVGDLTRAIGERGDAIATLSRAGRRTARVLASSDDALRQTLSQFPPTLRQVRATSGVLRSVTAQSTPVISRLAGVVGDLRPAVNALGPATVQGRQVLTQLDATTPPLRKTVRALRRAAGPLANALPQLHKTMCQLNPIVSRVRPYQDEVAALLQNLGSVTSYYDAQGHAGRLLPLAGRYSLAPQGSSLASGFQLLQDAGVLGSDPGVGYNPFPEPKEAPRPAAGRGLLGIDQYKTKYERVEAEC